VNATKGETIPLYRKKRRIADTTRESDQIKSLTFQFITELKNEPVSSSLAINKEIIRELFQDCSDAVVRDFEIEPGIPALLVLVDGLANTELVNETMKAIMILEPGTNQINELLVQNVPVSQTTIAQTFEQLLVGVMSGDTCILVEGNSQALLLGIRGSEKRSVNEPETETVVRGPREGFIENLRTNTSLLRRKLKTPHLKMKPLIIGKHSNTNIVITYIKGLADPTLVEEVEQRLKQINIDGVLESGYIEEFIQDNVYSPFPQVQYTERPDTLAASLLEGRVGIMTDGTPFALIVPLTFPQILQASEDYYERFQIGTLIRWLRYLFLFVSLLTPALYVAITTYHPELIPTTLLLSIAASRESIPFPAVIEALIMEITFEGLREAGIRLPKSIGSAVSILGALVVGQAAVQAGIVSAPIVIIVSITGIASFTLPRFNGAIAIRMLRFPIILIASMFGLYGILISLIMIVGHMANLRSFGVPYLSPIGPMSLSDLKDIWIRAPWSMMKKRPAMFRTLDNQRIGDKKGAPFHAQDDA
jgi:spore germination protein KA/spore germination protein